MITQKIQYITYYGEDQLPINITNLANLGSVDKIYYIDQDGNYISWLDALSAHNFLQGMTTLSSGKAYKIVSKASANFPYTLFFDGDDLKKEAEDARVDIDILQSNVSNLGFFTLNSYNEMLGASGVLREDLVTSSGVLREDLVTSSGALTSRIDQLISITMSEIVNSGIAGLENTAAVSGHLQADIISSGHAILEELSNNSNDLRQDLVTASGALRTSLDDTKVELTGLIDDTRDLIADAPTYIYDVVPNSQTLGSSTAYRFSGLGISESNQDNPTIYLRRGETYIFNVNAQHHPFYIKTANTTGTSDMYDTGVTNNGASVGTVKFIVPHDAPETLYYQCSNHAAMGGQLRSDIIPDLRQELIASGEAFLGELVASGEAFLSDLVASGTDFRGEMIASGTDFRGEMIASGTDFRGEMIASGTILNTKIDENKDELTELIINTPRYSFDVISDNSDPNLASAYRFSGVGITTANQDNPTIYLRRGETYIFNINTPNHPFYIKSANVIGTESIYNNGVQNNGFTDRTLIFQVPYDAPTLLYYQCSNHEHMHGLLYTVQPTFIELIDGGRPGSFSETGVTTTAGPNEVFDTTLSITTGNNVGTGGLTFTADTAGADSISFTDLNHDPINFGIPTYLYLFINSSAEEPIATLAIATTYRNSSNYFQVTINDIQYDRILFSITGDTYLNGIRVNLS
jgi:hypothetical protein